MGEAMRTEKEWSRNVGTESFPVSFLHEYAVGLIWDMLVHSNSASVQLPLLDGSLSGNLMEDVDKVIIPDALQSIAGKIPDISLLRDSRPIRCIEVVVTNPVPDQKAKAIWNLGVELFQVPVRNENELRSLFVSAPKPTRHWWAKRDETNEKQGETLYLADKRRIGFNWRGSPRSWQAQADRAILGLMDNLHWCSPEVRREFLACLRDVESLESLFPIRPDNPKYRSLQK